MSRINQEPALCTRSSPGLGGHQRPNFFSSARSIREGTLPTAVPSSSLSFSSFIQLRTFGLSHTWQAPQVHGSARTRRLLECTLEGRWRADFCHLWILSDYRILPSERVARWRTTRNLELSHYVLPHNSFKRSLQSGSPTAPRSYHHGDRALSNPSPSLLGDAVYFAGWAVLLRTTSLPRQLACGISLVPRKSGTFQSTTGQRADMDSSGLPGSVCVGEPLSRSKVNACEYNFTKTSFTNDKLLTILLIERIFRKGLFGNRSLKRC
jgi:hypothetical protein